MAAKASIKHAGIARYTICELSNTEGLTCYQKPALKTDFGKESIRIKIVGFGREQLPPLVTVTGHGKSAESS